MTCAGRRRRHFEMEPIVTTREAIAEAFTEWQRRWRTSPDAGVPPPGSPETFGDRAADYFIGILQRQRKERASPLVN